MLWVTFFPSQIWVCTANGRNFVLFIHNHFDFISPALISHTFLLNIEVMHGKKAKRKRNHIRDYFFRSQISSNNLCHGPHSATTTITTTMAKNVPQSLLLRPPFHLTIHSSLREQLSFWRWFLFLPPFGLIDSSLANRMCWQPRQRQMTNDDSRRCVTVDWL